MLKIYGDCVMFKFLKSVVSPNSSGFSLILTFLALIYQTHWHWTFCYETFSSVKLGDFLSQYCQFFIFFVCLDKSTFFDNKLWIAISLGPSPLLKVETIYSQTCFCPDIMDIWYFFKSSFLWKGKIEYMVN